MIKKKILYLKSNSEKTFNSLRQSLSKDFDIIVKNIIVEDSAPFGKEDTNSNLITEGEVLLNKFYCILIEDQLNVIDELISKKIRAIFARKFINLGGLFIFLNDEVYSAIANSPNLDFLTYNRFLYNAGLPQIYQTKTEGDLDLGYYKKHWEEKGVSIDKKIDKNVTRGLDEINKIDITSKYIIEINKNYKKHIIIKSPKIFESVSKLAVSYSIQLDGGDPVIVGNPDTTRLYVSGMDFFDSKLNIHTFGSFIESGNGIGLHIAGDMYKEKLPENDNATYIKNLILYFLQNITLENISINNIDPILKELNPKIPIILTEGKTDVHIIKSAWLTLLSSLRLPFIIKSCDTTAGISGGSAGVSSLKSAIENVRPGENPSIAIFDRDAEGENAFLKLSNFDVFENNLDIKIHKNKIAYAVLLPTPKNRQEYAEAKNLCIEFYFSDKIIEKEYPNKFGLKFKFPNEQVMINGIKVREYQSKKKAFRKIHSGKKEFSEVIVHTLTKKDFKNFEPLFGLLKKILKNIYSL
ncbi:hypothetical protein EHQ74_17765 [Leptospira levettii]|nr:hypothetical protein EHQ74_17765 [Leptospira levettii]